MQCLTLALENPPEAGEYRVFNQFEECYTVDELAVLVQQVARERGLDVELYHYENPRQEAEEHYYNPDREKLIELGYQPTHDVASEIRVMIDDLMHHRDRIEARRDVLVPDIRWDGSRHRSHIVEEPVVNVGEVTR